MNTIKMYEPLSGYYDLESWGLNSLYLCHFDIDLDSIPVMLWSFWTVYCRGLQASAGAGGENN